jgi:hypothetical protein
MDIIVTKESMLILLAEILPPQVRYSAALQTKNNELVPMSIRVGTPKLN